MRTRAFLGVLVQLSIASAEGLPERIPVVVSESIGAVRAAEMVCSGVPFPRAALEADEPIHVETRSGEAVPTQTKVLGRWPDGSVRWLLVQFAADCPAGGRRTYYLAKGPAPAPATPLVLHEQDERIIVRTGPLTATVSKTSLTVLEEVCLHRGDGEVRVLTGGAPMRFVLEDGRAHVSAASRPESVTIEERGPLRATIRLVGWLRGADGARRYKLDTRLRFYAGQPYVRASYTFICLGEPPLHRIKEVAVDLSPAVGRGPRFVLPGDREAIEGALDAGKTAVLSVDTALVCRAGIEGQQIQGSRPLDGWALLAGNGASVGVALRDFWHLGPKAIELAPDRITLALWSARGGRLLNLGRTRAKTHHVLYVFGAPRGDEGPILDRLRAFHQGLIAATDPTYFCTTDALGPLSPEGAAATAEFDRKVWRSFLTLHEQRETMPRENGMLHYGDYYHGGYGNRLTRGDLEYDTTHACFLLYARSGRRAYFDFAVACNQHFIDMDIDQETGDPRFHGYGAGAETHEAVTTGLEWGHVFVDGPADAYYLTGDERSLEAVRMIARRVATIADGEGYGRIRGIFAGAERQLGWPLMVLCRAYEVTEDERFLEAASKIAAYIKTYAKDPLAAYREGTWWRSWMMDGCKTFMAGQLHDGLAAYYEITRDEEMKDVIVTGLDWLLDHMWNPEVDGFVYEFNAMNRGHRLKGITGLNMLAADAFRVGYEITGDRRYLAVALRAFWSRVEEMKPEAVNGRQFSQDTRRSPHTAACLWREDTPADKLPPAPEPLRQQPGPRPAGARPEVLLRARFDGDLTCRTPEGKGSGKAVGPIRFVPGRRGRAVAVGRGGYAWFPAPREMLRRPGSMELWVRLHFKKNPRAPGQRAVFSVEGETPRIDSLAACTIYNELRIRMKDHVGHLNGTAEGAITRWEPNEWHHVVVTWDDDRVRLYLDGKEQTRENEGERAWDGVEDLPAGGQTRIDLGWRFGNWYCDCAIDELTVYGRALMPEEVAEKYAGWGPGGRP